MKKLPRIPANVRKPRQITPEAPPAPTEYPLSPETVALGAWIDSEESRLAEERARASLRGDGSREITTHQAREALLRALTGGAS